MNVIINGTARELAAGASVGDAVRLVTAAASGIAAAVNGEVVRRACWDATPVAESDQVEVITAAQGG